MAINHDCKDYKREETKRNVLRNTLDEVEPVIRHLCFHRQNTKDGQLTITSKRCGLNNDFCPYNPELNNKT
jgi:hypothetical protein